MRFYLVLTIMFLSACAAPKGPAVNDSSDENQDEVCFYYARADYTKTEAQGFLDQVRVENKQGLVDVDSFCDLGK